ncbi:MAG: flagellar hook-length control protein FliK [Chitinispirillaceae bacterium]|nr:flagellar hook-length control protein FliK [Chitinispirillaceae bacterium]
MRPDAMAFSFFTRMARQDRMDRTQAGQKPVPAQGFGTGTPVEGDSGEGFKAVYVQVARSNEQAAKVTDPAVSGQAPSENTDELSAGDQMLQELLGQQIAEQPQLILQSEALVENGLEGLALEQADLSLPELAVQQGGGLADHPVFNLIRQIAPDLVPSIPTTGTAAEASVVISQALVEISEAMHLKIDSGLQNLMLTESAGDLSGQFSEILYTLKQIVQVLQEAVAKNQAISLDGKTVIGVPQAKELVELVQVRIFRIEIGVSMLGIADKVQAELAQKLSLPQSGGIVQALDPKSIAMPQAQMEKVFGEVFKDSSPNIALLVQKMRELCARYGQAGNNGAAMKVVEVSAAVTETVRTVTLPGNVPFGSQVLRKLLNIEAKELLAAQNTEAANQAVRMYLTPGAVNSALQGIDVGALKTADELLPIGDTSGKAQMTPLFAGFETKSVLASYRTTDETVMSQISERLQTAVRSGLTEIRLMLRPESLGEVRLRIRVEGDVVFARIHVESQVVKQMVETNLQSLKDSLAQQQLNCGSLEVSVGNDGWNDKSDGVHGNRNGKAAHAPGTAEGDHEDETDPADVALGAETGRRFGDNTVEYFA